MSKWVGVITITVDEPRGSFVIEPMAYTTGAHDDQASARLAAENKARTLLRMGALVATSEHEKQSLTAAADQVVRVGRAHFEREIPGRTEHVTVRLHVAKLTDDASLF